MRVKEWPIGLACSATEPDQQQQCSGSFFFVLFVPVFGGVADARRKGLSLGVQGHAETRGVNPLRKLKIRYVILSEADSQNTLQHVSQRHMVALCQFELVCFCGQIKDVARRQSAAPRFSGAANRSVEILLCHGETSDRDDSFFYYLLRLEHALSRPRLSLYHRLPGLADLFRIVDKYRHARHANEK